MQPQVAPALALMWAVPVLPLLPLAVCKISHSFDIIATRRAAPAS